MSKLLATLLLAAAAAAGQSASDLAEEVRRTEVALARSMAQRDHAAFTTFLASEAVFIGRTRVLRGAAQVAEGWKSYFNGPRAPFSWEPEQVQVLDSGTLAVSSGPVRDPDGKRIGTFNTIWRREADGKWKVVIDHGCPPCECPAR